ncbi:MAG: glycosyltransferase [Candidatus Aenigmarchaeota archaeon]|nr:glycosyltransferase [Candidatus Aenigmarchaeota archaeon]
MTAKVTVVIPTINNEKDIEDCLKGLQKQTYKDFEILLVDGYSKDKTVEIGKKYGAKVVYDDGHTRAHACNTALKHVKTSYIAFTDADCIPMPDWLEEIMKEFEENGNIAGVGGPNYAPPSDSDFAKAVDVVYSSRLVTGTARYGRIYEETREIEHNPGCNAAYKTEVLKKVGFDDELPTAEDVVADYNIIRNGGILYFTPKAVVWHHRRNNLKGFWKQIYRYGLGRAMANKKYKELFNLFHIMPSSAIILFPVFTIIAFLSLLCCKFIFYLWAVSIVVYLVSCLYGAIASYSKYKNLKTIIIALFLIPIAHLAWGIGYLQGMRK